MKYKEVKKSNWPPIRHLNRTNNKGLPQPAFIIDTNKLGDDVEQLYTNFKSATGSVSTVVSGDTGSFTITDTDVETGTTIIASVASATTTSGYPVLLSAEPGDESITVKVTNFDRDKELIGATVELNYIIDKELS